MEGYFITSACADISPSRSVIPAPAKACYSDQSGLFIIFHEADS
jgi:hypothetical protein